MKAINVILKILAVLAAIAGIVYVAATYGDRIVAWCRKMLGKLECLCDSQCVCDCGCQCEDDCDDCPCEDDCESCACENCCCEEEAEPAEEIVEEASAETAVAADEADFEG